jgi:hypothetical protein
VVYKKKRLHSKQVKDMPPTTTLSNLLERNQYVIEQYHLQMIVNRTILNLTCLTRIYSQSHTAIPTIAEIKESGRLAYKTLIISCTDGRIMPEKFLNVTVPEGKLLSPPKLRLLSTLMKFFRSPHCSQLRRPCKTCSG